MVGTRDAATWPVLTFSVSMDQCTLGRDGQPYKNLLSKPFRSPVPRGAPHDMRHVTRIATKRQKGALATCVPAGAWNLD